MPNSKRVKAFGVLPLVAQEKLVGHSLFVHPSYQLAAGFCTLYPPDHEEEDVAVLALPHLPLNRAARASAPERPHPAQDDLVDLPVRHGCREKPGDALLHGDVHVLPFPGSLPVVIGMMAPTAPSAPAWRQAWQADVDGWAIRVAGEKELPSHPHENQVSGLVAAIGSSLAKGADGDHDNPLVDPAEGCIAQSKSFHVSGLEGTR